MRLDRRFLDWGVFFILLGGIPLAVDQGWLTADVVSGWWRYWPFIIIGIGVGLVLRRTPVHFLGGLIVAATCGLMFGSALAGGIGGRFDFACTNADHGTSFSPQSGALGPSAVVNLEMNCGDLQVTTAAGGGWTLSGTSPGGNQPRLAGDLGRLEIQSAERTGVSFFGSGGTGETWNLALPTDPTLDLGATLNAGSARFDLAGAKLGDVSLTTNAGNLAMDLGTATARDLSATVNAGSTTINLPNSDLQGSVTVNAGRFAFCAPAGADLRITTSDSILGSNNFAQQGLVRDGSAWTSPNYGLASVQIELSATANLGSLELNPQGGCK